MSSTAADRVLCNYKLLNGGGEEQGTGDLVLGTSPVFLLPTRERGTGLTGRALKDSRRYRCPEEPSGLSNPTAGRCLTLRKRAGFRKLLCWHFHGVTCAGGLVPRCPFPIPSRLVGPDGRWGCAVRVQAPPERPGIVFSFLISFFRMTTLWRFITNRRIYY